MHWLSSSRDIKISTEKESYEGYIKIDHCKSIDEIITLNITTKVKHLHGK